MINSFLLVGQSNMVGRGLFGEVPPIVNPKIKAFLGGVWVVAEEPIFDEIKAEDGHGVTLSMSFADTLQKKYGKEIGLIPCAVGASFLHQWHPGEKFYEDAVAKATEALKTSKLKGILWMQGEQDCDTEEHATTYYERFFPFMNALVKTLKAENLPFILGELGDYLEAYDYCKDNYATINAELRKIAVSAPVFGYASAEGFQTVKHEWDLVHLNSASLREFGLRFAKQWELAAERLGTILE